MSKQDELLLNGPVLLFRNKVVLRGG